MDPLALEAVIASCLTGIGGGIAALLRFRPENRKIAADASATVVGAATGLISAQAGELTRLAEAIKRLEDANTARDDREVALRREVDELKGELANAIHERDESFLREGVLKGRVGKLEQELAAIKATPATPPVSE